ncbi:MAG: aldo/keto reductase family protein [candidate division Zixibacteria bacterium]|nr:aldo/keto reductase family protein [candidate division Zixibacteria bacterium]
MNYRQLGKAGIKISEISLGAWLTYGNSVDAETTKKIIAAAVDRGVNFIDVADIYARGEAENVVGQAIKNYRRSDLVISSKVFWPMSDNINDRGLSRKHILESVDRSLARLGVDYLDLYFCHRFDPETEIEEVVRAMEDLVRGGKIIYWGTSVWDADQIERAVGQAKSWGAYLPSVEQPRYNLFDRHIETDIIPMCARYGMGLVVWSPLAQGLLTGKYNNGVPSESRGGRTEWLKDGLTEKNINKVKKLAELAASQGISVAQLALAWVLRLKEISCAIVGATRVEQLEENLKASEVALDEESLKEIESIFS